jgi:hypothetical protein
VPCGAYCVPEIIRQGVKPDLSIGHFMGLGIYRAQRRRGEDAADDCGTSRARISEVSQMFASIVGAFVDMGRDSASLQRLA